jgi:AcrR family transcriptional regulator
MRAVASGRVRAVSPDIARELIAATDELGASFDALRMDDLAKASGIPRATLYYHFAGKDDIVAFLHEVMLAEHRAAVQVEGGGPARERLTLLLARHRAHVSRHPGSAQLLVVHLGRLRGLSELATTMYDPMLEPIEQILRDGVATGELRSIDVRRTATAISNTAHVAAIRSVVSGDLDDVEEAAAWLVDLFWDGVAASARP